MSNFYTHPRILFVSPDPAFMPKGEGTATEFMSAERDPGFPVRLALELYKQGLDVYVTQPDFRNIFENCRRKKNNCSNFTLPVDRVHLAQDRAFFHSKIIDLNSEKDNLKIALAFQREVINQIIPRIQPEIIHCCGWMTGLIPAAGRKLGIPCLFTAQKFDSASSCLSYVEDRGIDAAAFWQFLYYKRYPINYMETRETNPADFLLSGILAADFVTTSRSAYLADGYRIQGRAKFPIWEVIVKKSESGCVAIHHYHALVYEYVGIYEKLLRREIHQSGGKTSSFCSRILGINTGS